MLSHCYQVMDRNSISTVYLKVSPIIMWCVLTLQYCLVDSNDSLYGGDKKFIAEISKIADTIINLLLEHLKELSSTEEASAERADPVTTLWLFCFHFSLWINNPSMF